MHVCVPSARERAPARVYTLLFLRLSLGLSLSLLLFFLSLSLYLHEELFFVLLPSAPLFLSLSRFPRF